jgi:hypothetical protein
MAKDLLMVRSGTHLVPADGLAEEDVLELPNAKPLMVKITTTRSLPQHRLLFGLIRKTARSTPTPITENALRQWLTVRTGHVDIMPLGFGKSYEAPRSWAFDRMDGDEFRKLFDDVVHLILTEVAPNLPDTFADEFLAILDGRDGAAAKNAAPRAA